MLSFESNLVINARRFESAITASHFHSPSRKRAFYFDVTFVLDNPHLIKLASAEKPPLHFHPYQEEYIEVTEGRLGVEVQGTEYVLTPKDGEFAVQPWANHRLYPLIPALGSGELHTTRFLLSGQDTKDTFKLETVFFQNWYGYQDAVVVGGQKMDLVQVMNMFDAGGSYMSFPSWLPCSGRLAQLTGILVGRWIGGLLGYQPFHRKWTSDWQTACDKMKTSPFLRRFTDQTKHE